MEVAKKTWPATVRDLDFPHLVRCIPTNAIPFRRILVPRQPTVDQRLVRHPQLIERGLHAYRRFALPPCPSTPAYGVLGSTTLHSTPRGPKVRGLRGGETGVTAASFLLLLKLSVLRSGRRAMMRLIAAVKSALSRNSGSATAGRRARSRRMSCRHSSCTAPTLNDARGRQRLGGRRNSSQEGYGCSGVLQLARQKGGWAGRIARRM